MCWFADTPLRAGDRLALKQGTRTVRATVQELHSRLDPETLDDLDGPFEPVSAVAPADPLVDVVAEKAHGIGSWGP